MAASAYAAVVSLLNTMDQFQSHPRLSTSFDPHQNQHLRSNIDFFLEFVENYHGADSIEVGALMSQIAAAAHEAEDAIDVEAVDRIFGGYGRISLTLLLNVQRIVQDMDSIKKKVIKVKEETGSSFINSMPPPPSSSPPSTKTSMVGFECYLARLLDELVGHHSGRQILPIVGMGGIGKTTLARNVYQDSITVDHFEFRAWVTVSQEFNKTELLLQALACLRGSKSKNDKSDDELRDELHQIFSGRRYLVVLDDLWSVEAWEKIKFSFPDNNNGSRIVVTTRQQDVANDFSSSSLVVDFLGDQNSWELFCKETFLREGCPLKLEKVGRRIVANCKGLPLAIAVVGGLLQKLPRTLECWHKIARDKSLIPEDSCEGNEILSILSLSYKHLPVWLKPCFLYLGLFPEDYPIQVSTLIQLWIAEGFVKPSGNRTLEEVAESYIRELVERNLLLFVKPGRKKKLIVRLHDVVREVCIKIAEKENFYRVQRDRDGRFHFIVDEGSASFYPQTASQRPSLMNPLILDEEIEREREAPIRFKSRLLRVLAVAGDTGWRYFPVEQVNLRFLFHGHLFLYGTIPCSLSLCWSLQTLIMLSVSIVLPSVIWEMPQLRHIEIELVCLSDPPRGDGIVLHSLHTLMTTENLIFTEEVCKRVPNIKKLGISYNFDEEGVTSRCFKLQNLALFNKLQILTCWGTGFESVDENPFQNIKLPCSLKELCLEDCHLVWGDMLMIAALPRLESLSLKGKVFAEAEWKFGEGFRCLKHLSIHDALMVNWIAEKSHFPVLEKLALSNLSRLVQFPLGFGKISTLTKMKVFKCSESATKSAVTILAEQESFEYELRLHLEFDSKTEVDNWRDEIKSLGITSQNLRFIQTLRRVHSE